MVARATAEKPSLAKDRNMKYPNMEVIKDILDCLNNYQRGMYFLPNQTL